MYYIYAQNGDAETPIYAPETGTDAVCTGSLKEELGATPSLSLTLYSPNPAFDLLTPLTSWVGVYNYTTDETEFWGRVLTVEDGMTDAGVFYRTVVCEGALGVLQDSVYSTAPNWAVNTPAELLNMLIIAHNNQVTAAQKVYVGNCTMPATTGAFAALAGYDTIYNVLQAAVALVGGVVSARYEDGNVYIDWLADETLTDATNAIYFGTNLVSIARTYDPTTVCTKLWAWGKEDSDSGVRVDISSVNNGNKYLEDTALEDTLGVKINAVYTNGDCETPEALLAAAQAEFNARRGLTWATTVKAVDLVYNGNATQSYRVGYSYEVGAPPLGIEDTVRVIGRTVSIEEPFNPTLTLGSTAVTATQLIAALRKKGMI